MATITLIEGSVDIKSIVPKFKYISERNEMAFLVKGEKIPRVISTAMVSDLDFLKWVCQNSRYDTYILFSKKIPAGFSKTGLKLKINTLQTIKGAMPQKEDLFKMLDLVAFSHDRNAVYDALSKSNSQYIISAFLMSNPNALGQENITVLMQLDALALLKNTQNTNEILAYALKPVKPPIYWKYAFPKKEDAEEAEDA